MMDSDYQYIYRLPAARRRVMDAGSNRLLLIIVLLSVGAPLIFFVIQAISTGDAGWLIMLGFSGLLMLLLGPYTWWARQFYFLGITTDNVVVVRSIVNLVPRRATFAIDRIKFIRSPNPQYSQGLTFLDIDRRRLGVFNTAMIPDKEFQKFLAILRQHNQILKFLDW